MYTEILCERGIAMTLSRIAMLANVSVSTASKAFSLSSEISEQTREHVFEVAKRYGCFKQFYKAKYPRYVIGIVCPELASIYYGRLIEGLQLQLKELGCDTCIINAMFSKVAADTGIDYFSDYSSVDGIIALEIEARGSQISVPFVSLSDVVSVGKRGVDAAIKYLKSKGICDIGFIGEHLTKGKLDDFCAAMLDNGLKVNEYFICVSDTRFEKGGYLAAKRIFDRASRPKALICAYDYMAMGAIRCLHDVGLSVPKDVMVIGMDNVPEAEYFIPSISSIGYGDMEKAKALAKGIIDKINGTAPAVQTVDEALFLRESSEI
jgi:DNA-binding LacI/PurR family transcriptional regulator